jgi:hypothetical protein
MYFLICMTSNIRTSKILEWKLIFLTMARNARIILPIELHNYLPMFSTKSEDYNFNFIKIINLKYSCFSCSNSSVKYSNALLEYINHIIALLKYDPLCSHIKTEITNIHSLCTPLALFTSKSCFLGSLEK